MSWNNETLDICKCITEKHNETGFYTTRGLFYVYINNAFCSILYETYFMEQRHTRYFYLLVMYNKKTQRNRNRLYNTTTGLCTPTMLSANLNEKEIIT